MNWEHNDTIALARHKCVICKGSGLVIKKASTEACKCVFRAVFRKCYDKFHECMMKSSRIGRITKQVAFTAQRRHIWGRKDEEFIADFTLVSKRSLTEEEYTLFKYHYLLGADWKLCVRKMKIDKGTFFHQVYHVEQKLGRIFRELEPYALFPIDEYFRGSTKDEAKVIAFAQKRQAGRDLAQMVPLKKAA